MKGTSCPGCDSTGEEVVQVHILDMCSLHLITSSAQQLHVIVCAGPALTERDNVVKLKIFHVTPQITSMKNAFSTKYRHKASTWAAMLPWTNIPISKCSSKPGLVRLALPIYARFASATQNLA